MPKFLENALRHEARKKGLTGKEADHYVFGGMNSIGAMKGSKETAKGREMEKKHMADEKKATPSHNMREMRIEVMRGKGGNVTGHIVHHEMMRKPSKSGAFMTQDETEKYPFGAHGEPHAEGSDGLIEHVARHLGLGGDDMENPAPKESKMEEESEDD